MADTSRVAVITQDETLPVRCTTEASDRYKIVPFIIPPPESHVHLRRYLKDVVSEILGLNDGNIDFHFAIVDPEFHATRGPSYFVADALFDDLPEGAGSLLAMLLGAGLPVLVSANTGDFSRGWQVGTLGAKRLELERLSSQLDQEEAELRFNRNTLEVENEFALEYDEKELAGAATVSAILWENDYVLKSIRQHVDKAPHPVAILDLGCGTGRFEELLLTDAAISRKVARIVAVDFAPMYLVQAQKRLGHFVRARELRKVTYLRRIAEDLKWPSNFFDIVLASFGIVCFSRSHLTLREIHRVLRSSGLAIVNGYNRLAMTFEFDEVMMRATGSPASHFAIRIDREENKMQLGDRYIDCFTFDVGALYTYLAIVGLKPLPGSVETFPTLYGSARKDYLTQLRGQGSPRAKARRHHICLSQRDCAEFASYQRANLVEDQYGSGFNEILHMMDLDLAPVLSSKGFYFCIAVHK